MKHFLIVLCVLLIVVRPSCQFNFRMENTNIRNRTLVFAGGIREVNIEKGTRTYHIGQRKSDDRLIVGVGQYTVCFKSCELAIMYSSNQGVISSVECEVHLKDGLDSIRTYVKNGGIGQKSIQTVIELYKTEATLSYHWVFCRGYES